MMNNQDTWWLEKYSHVHMNVFGTPLRVLDHGQGAYVWDIDGNQYLDFLAGIAVNSLGYAHPDWVHAVSQQAQMLAHTSNYFASVPQIELATKLLEITNAPKGSRVYFANSGTEGNEAALKLVKLHAHEVLHNPNARIIALDHGFHGRTLGALAATWKPAIREPYEPLMPNVEFVPAGDIAALESAFEAETPVAGVIMELIQGEAGVQAVGGEFVAAARALCDRYGALLVIDEVQTGIGRTGSWFAFQQKELSGGIMPDIVTFAKGVASGFPMGGAIAFGDNVARLFGPGLHGSTFAGNPLAAKAALTTLQVIERDNLLDNVVARGQQLRELIATCGNSLFTSIHGAGLLNAIELSKPCAHAAMQWALKHGLIVNAVTDHSLRIAPPLIVGEQQVRDAVAILAEIPTDLVCD